MAMWLGTVRDVVAVFGGVKVTYLPRCRLKRRSCLSSDAIHSHVPRYTGEPRTTPQIGRDTAALVLVCNREIQLPRLSGERGLPLRTHGQWG
jgi:hypothetical protein